MAVAIVDLSQTGLDLATVAMYGYVGWRLSRRRVDGPARLANNLFATWWVLLAGLTALTVVQRAAAVAGVDDLAFYLTILEIQLLVLCVALWALLYYFVYVLTGSRRAMAPITIFYAAYYVGLVFLVTARHPTGIVRDGATATLRFANEASGPANLIVLVLLLGPVLVGAAGYFRLFFRIEEPTQRYRIGLIAVTILVWFGIAAGASVAGLAQLAWWRAASSLLGLGAAISIYFAYQPPRFVRERYGVRPVNEESAG